MISLQRTSDRLSRPEIFLEAVSFGNDWQLNIWGGAKHLGAVSLAEPGKEAQVLIAAGHCEGPLSREIAELCARELDCRIAVCCGIHYDDINKEEIAEVLLLAQQLINEFLSKIKKQ